MRDQRAKICAPKQNPPVWRSVRLAQGLSLRVAATRASIDPGHLSKVERGEKMLSPDAMLRLAQTLGLTEFARLLELYLPARQGEP